MNDPPSGSSGANTPRAPPAIAADWPNGGADDAAAAAAPAAASGGYASSPRMAINTSTTSGGAAAPPAAALTPLFSVRSRQASMSRPRPAAVAESIEEPLAVTDAEEAAEAAAYGGGVSMADIAAAAGPSRKPSMTAKAFAPSSNKVSPAPAAPAAPSATDKVLDEFDANKDNRLDAQELAALVNKMVQEREDKRRLLVGLIAVLVVLVVLIGALTGMTWAVVAAFKDTDVQNGVMYVKGSTSEVVQTASAEMTIVDGALINRQALSAAAMTTNATANTTTNNNSSSASVLTAPDSVVRTADFVGTPVKFGSRVNIRQLMELKYLYITGMGEVEVALVVQGVARVPDADSVWGTVVHIITAAGTITLDDTVVRFEQEIAPVFVRAGFAVSRSRRSLLGIYDVLGFFNFIADLEVFNLPPDQPRPALPSNNFMMQLKIYEPCVFPFDPSSDRCIAPPTDGALNPDDTSATASSNSSSARRRLQLQALQQLLGPMAPPSPSGPLLPLLAGPEQQASGVAGGKRRSALATAPHTHARMLQSTDAAGTFLHDLAGVEVVNGSRYMTHTETAHVWQGLMRTVYEYALFPAYRRVEVASNASAQLNVWQEEALPDGAEVNPQTWFCMQNPLPPGKLDKYSDLKNTSAVNFTFLGYTELYGKSARHFRLSIRQPVNKTNPNPGLSSTDPLPLPEVVEFDYFDNRKDFSPLGFELNHPIAGHIMIQVVQYRNLTAADVSTAMFSPPAGLATGACTNDTSIPRLSSPFTVPAFNDPTLRTTPNYNPDTLLDANPSPAAGRRLAEQAAQLAAQWDALDHVNGSDVHTWPQWALDTYGSGGDREVLRERLLMEGGYHPHGRVMQTGVWCSQNKFTKKWERSSLPCSVEASLIQASHLEVIGSCNGSNLASFPNLKLGGFATINTCTKEVSGCAKLSLTLVPYLDKVSILKTIASKIGLTDMDVFSLCAGYNWADLEGFVTGILSPSVIVLRAELVGTLKWSPCCVWLDEVSLEGFVGVTAGSYDLSSSIGKWKIVENPWYWKGSAGEAARNRVPAVQNLARVDAYTVGETEWGEWGEIQYCHERFTTDSSKSKARPIVGFRLRVEEYLGYDSDDTSLNGLKIKCTNSEEIDVDDGNWGDWQPAGNCPSGKYITAARMKLESSQGSFTDDTAANGIEFKCNDNTVVRSGSGDFGSWGSWVSCPTNQYICGLQVKMEEPQGTVSDDTAMNGLKFYCCYIIA
ncbi:hypothetical protein CHLRE_10g420450v5 [Chlamydomonas reinhardtii]|uniref:EF-hand domain-containing protein n=1 Tax=Chlamydomonas reinhardtii TaxID=3055 RepID=A0A2K3D952_CHLRE|nr:uncharacterized protein CHLRE_10g420450v5 [Chlamydomonas reinhardtii]PNW77055.1 hypothetical protein CHLRE_10g420450v5 [Chlamydomonas reinhardtii]